MRRLVALLVLPLLVTLPVPAFAAEGRHATLSLVQQAPWNTHEQPDIRLKVRATNDGERTLRDLSIAVTLFTPTRSRTDLENSLVADPASTYLSLPTELDGDLEPGESRMLTLPRDVRDHIAQTVFAGRDESAIYPMKVELRSRDEPIAELRSPVIFLRFAEERRRAQFPLGLGWAFVLHRPLLYGPAGTFLSDELERDVAAGGVLRAEVDALAAMTTGPSPRAVDLVLSPTLLEQLERMAAGYTVRGEDGTERTVAAGQGGSADAAAVLDAIRRIAAATDTEVAGMPFGAPSVPALLDAGLTTDLDRLLALGAETTSRLSGAEVRPDLFWHPNGYFDQASLFEMWSRGARTFLLESGRVERPAQPLEFADPATAALTVTPTRTAKALAPDEGVARRLSSDLMSEDPRLGLQAFFAELAQIWLEQPGIPRAVSMIIPDELRLQPATYARIVRWVSEAPWMRPYKLSYIAKRFPPDPEEPAELLTNPGPQFSESYLDGILESRRMIETYEAMLVTESDLPEQLDRQTLLSLSGTFVGNEAPGSEFIIGVEESLQSRFDQISIDISGVVTLTSHEGVIPLVVNNDSDDHIRVVVRLDSRKLDPAFEAKEIQILPRTPAGLLFRVTSRITGRFPVRVQVLTPNRVQLSQVEVIVRSTAYNLIALVITFGAALFLLLYWGRRFLPRRRPA